MHDEALQPAVQGQQSAEWDRGTGRAKRERGAAEHRNETKGRAGAEHRVRRGAGNREWAKAEFQADVQAEFSLNSIVGVG